MFGGNGAAERSAATSRTRPHDADSAADATLHTLQRELEMLHETVARNKRELAALVLDGNERRMARAAGELGASIDGMEKATVKILKSSEIIDESARALGAAMKNDYERGLAHDIQEQVVAIYEACNFQDLSGQRIGKVIAMLNEIERQVEAMIEHAGLAASPHDASAAAKPNRDLLNGPKLDGEQGHASQRDIDALFG